MKRKKFLPSLLILLILPLLLVAFYSVRQLLIRAKGVPANIEVDTAFVTETLNPVWNSFAQGGEESTDMIAPAVNEISQLQPRYIRIDHLYDYYNVVNRNSQGQLEFNFAGLDQAVASIRKTGALPFFALSYMPSAIAENGDITGKPRDWNEWSLVVRRTIEHYSGRNNLNLNNIYYEVWNEPDLFGKWLYYGNKNYLNLYAYASYGAQSATNTNIFKFGGPATTNLYKNWMVALADFVNANNLRMDFISWHHYSISPEDIGKNAKSLTEWLFYYPNIVILPRVISEWGFNSEMSSGYDNNFAAAHALATIRQTLNGYEQLLAFELVDGPSPQKQSYWGRWGLLTHPSAGKTKKPRFFAFQALNQIKGDRLLLKGEGTYVTAIATKNNQTVNLLVVNFDPQSRNIEAVPLKLINLANGNYQLVRQRSGLVNTTQQINITDNTYSTQIVLPVNNWSLISLTQVNPFLVQPD